MEQTPERLHFSLPSTDDDLTRVLEDYSATRKDAFDVAADQLWLPVFGRGAPCIGQPITVRPRVVGIQHVLVASGDPGAARNL